jgi:menaquinone-dependent protoporphyrinogen oxidase
VKIPGLSCPGIRLGKGKPVVRKVLVTCASRRGSTAEAADVVASVLRDKGMDVVVRPVRKVRSLSGYDAVILGTAIRAEKPLSESVRFAARFGPQLSDVPTALFILCLTMAEDTPKNRKKVSGWITPLVTWIRPGTVGLFAGAAEKDRLGFLLGRFMEKLLAGEGMELGDYRDWDNIRKWAGYLSESLQRTPQEQVQP